MTRLPVATARRCPGGLVSAEGEALGAGPLVFQELREQDFRLGESLLTGLAVGGRQTVAYVSPVVPQPGSSLPDRFQPANDPLLAPQQPQELRVVVGFDQAAVGVWRVRTDRQKHWRRSAKVLEEVGEGRHGISRCLKRTQLWSFMAQSSQRCQSSRDIADGSPVKTLSGSCLRINCAWASVLRASAGFCRRS